jgi:GDP-4-dehydro-6-deoxy-D-mannose reductase
MRVLVTGAEGFVAQHLIPVLRADGADVVGTAIRDNTNDLSVTMVTLDVTDTQRTRELVRDVRPSHIVHLAAVSSVRVSFQNPQAAEDVNVRGTQGLLEAAAALPTPPLVLLIGSGDEYGPNEGKPLPELPLSELRPVSPYGKSKKAVEELVEKSPAFLKFTLRTRSFPHIGPRQAGHFFVPEVATEIVRIERAQQPPVIGVGNLSAVRDLTDVRDVVRAYLLLLKEGKRGEVYNVCSGVAILIQDLLKKLIALSDVQIRAEQDPQKVRPVDIPVLVGDNSKLRKATAWKPEIPLDGTLRDVLEYHRGRPS